MASSILNIYCLIDGEGTSNAFPVEIESTKTIGDLKKLIKAEQSPDFDNIVANNFILWRASIPDDNQSSAITIEALDDKTELDKPRTRLSQLFPESPDDNTYILVQLPTQGLISEHDFVRFVPGPITGQQQRPGPSTSTSHRSISVTPSVRLWEGFKDGVRSMPLDPTSLYRPPQFKEDRVFRPEVSLQELFSNDVGSVRLLPPFADTTRIMGLPRGIPDLVCMKEGGDADDPDSVLFPLEIKRPIILRSTNLARDYEEQEQSGAAAGPVQRALKQVFGYIRLNGLDTTWFLMRVEQDSTVLLVSPAIAFDSTEPTLLKSYLWFIRKAHNDHEWIKDPPNDQDLETILEDENSPDDKPERTDNQLRIKTRSTSKITTRVVLPVFDNMELISHNESAHTYKASWQGRSVVVKKCDLWNERAVVQELRHEARIYQVLRTLQGRCIPTLRIAAVADGFEMVLVTDLVGCDVSRVRLDDSDQEKIRRVLSAIHDLGVVHGDLRPQNIVVQRDGSTSSFYFVDFGLSRITTDKSELFQETAFLDSLLRNLATARS
ncbi:hypothetical protein BGX24_009603 [Mortierella sp. AD032]|nr:hypothetical protein BGX24_009603 [Mortierella sp. AD032]